MALDLVHHLRMPCQFLIGRIANVVPLCPVTNCRQVNVDKCGTFGTAIAKHHGLKNIREKLQLVLNVFRREQAAIGHFANVLGTVDDAQMSCAFLDKSRVAGGNPAFGIFGISRAFGVFVVFNKNTGAAVKHLAIVGDLQLYAGASHANRVTAHFAIWLCGDEHGCFGLAVQLLQVDPETAIEIKDFRPDRLARRIANAHAA